MASKKLTEINDRLYQDPSRVLWRLQDSERFPRTRLRWHESLATVPVEGPPIFIVGQEVIDAFPAHQFVMTESGWREKLVDVDDSPETPTHFRWVLAPTGTPATAALVLGGAKELKDMKQTHDQKDVLTVEVSPGALALVDDVAQRVAKAGGAGLFVDYGKMGCLGDTLRAFKRHAQVSPLSQPGLCDLTVDADFQACGRQAALVDDVRVFGAVNQGEWLGRMGITQRLDTLLDNDKLSDVDVDVLITACERLCSANHMGERYKVLSINHDRWAPQQNQSPTVPQEGLHNRDTHFPPAGFNPEDWIPPPTDPADVIAP